MASPFIGEIHIFGFNFAPRGYAHCSGQVMSIAQNTALFSLLGTTYGGNGQTTFGLPDLRGRVPNGMGTMVPGLSDYFLGQAAGTENATLTINNMPAHSHGVACIDEDGAAQLVKNNLLSNPFSPTAQIYGPGAAANATMAPQMIKNTGGNQPFGILQPYLTLNYCIALQGIFPSRN